MSVKLVFLAFLLHLGCALAHPYGYNVCFEPLYQKLAPLSDYPPALSFCSQRYPRPPCTVTKRPTAVSTKVVTIPVTNTATVTTGYSTDIVYTATAISYIYTSTVVKTTTTSTSTATRYTSTSIQTVYTHSSFPVAYTSTATEYTVTGTDTITVPIATLPTTVTTTTVSTTSTVKTTTTVSSGTKTVTTHVDHGLRKRTAHPAQPSTTDPSSDPGKRSYGYPTKRDLFNRLKGLNRNKLQNACSCLKPKKH
ncbi:hypothetical protein B0T10DRAFT_206057 [Thelonectria olida]|uniref:Uncharacterized protein n=1 Tax=Thelonectria olida TaxID=1576542 RepID=A0A9P9ALD9_9HYPO|nr:hypothetical protein B0T10DRAFT_206057 [Thelonectria olida]